MLLKILTLVCVFKLKLMRILDIETCVNMNYIVSKLSCGTLCKIYQVFEKLLNKQEFQNHQYIGGGIVLSPSE